MLNKFQVKIALVIFGGLLSACGLFNTTTKKAAPDELFLVTKYDVKTSVSTQAFMDKTGKIVLGPWTEFEWNGKKYGGSSNTRFEFLPFVGGMAGVCLYESHEDRLLKDGVCGFIDKTGKLAVEPKYKQIGYYSEGLAAVSEDKTALGKFGYIDQTGKMVIEPRFSSKNPFSDGLAAVNENEKQHKSGYVDKTGKYVIEVEDTTFLHGFADGFAITLDDNRKIAIIDKTGKEIKTIETESAGNTDYHYKTSIYSSFYEGYAVEDYSAMPAFNENLTMVYDRGKTLPIGYTNTKGELEIKLDPQIVGQLRPFADGFAPIGWRPKDAEKLEQIMSAEEMRNFFDWTYVDRKGEIKVALDDTFQDARPFSEQLAAVKPRPNDKGNWGFINTEFKLVIPACFEKVSDFRADLAKVLIYSYAKEIKGCEAYDTGTNHDERNAYIDKTGKIIKPQW